MSRRVPTSTGRAAYIPSTSSAMSATTPRSWGIMMMAEPLRAQGAGVVERMQAGERVLQDHGDLLAAGVAQLVRVHLEQVGAHEQRLAGDLRTAGTAEDGQAGHALARA